MGQTVWNTLHGRFFSFSGDGVTISRLSIHADFLLVLFAPLYFIWNNVRVLLVAQSVGLALGAIPVYLLSRKVFSQISDLKPVANKIISLIFALVYLLNPAMQWTNSYDFHAVAFVIPLFLTTFYFAYTKRWFWYIFFAFLTLLTKEEVGLDLAMLGLVIAVFFKQKRLGLATFIVGVTWSLIMIFLVIPAFSPTKQHWAFSWYNFSDSSTPVSTNQKIITYLEKLQVTFSPGSLSYYRELLKPFAYLPLIGLPWILISLPEILINTLSSHGQMQSIYFHYHSAIIPSLVIASIFGLYFIFRFIQKLKIFNKFSGIIIVILSFGLLIVAARVNYHNSPLPISPSCWCFVYQVTSDDIEFEKVLRSIPTSASVTASPEVRAHLTRRENSFTLPSSVDTADYIAMIDQNRIVGNYEPKIYENELIPKLINDKNYLLVKHLNHFWLFKKIDSKFPPTVSPT